MNRAFRVQGQNMSLKTALCMAFFFVAAFMPAACSHGAITPPQASQFKNQFTTVCGRAVQGIYMPELDNRPTFIYLDKPFPDQIFEIVIWGWNRGQFARVPEVLYPGRTLCVEGIVIDFLGVPQIIVDQSGQISILNQTG